MKPFLLTAILAAASALFAATSFAGDWSEIIPPEIAQQQKAEVKRREMTVRVGEVVSLPLPGNRSYSCPVEIAGDAARIVTTDGIDNLTLQATRPGTAKVRIYRVFWRERDLPESRVPVEEITLKVVGNYSPAFGEKGEVLKEVPPPQKTADLDWEGSLSFQADELVTVITEEKDWTTLWQRAFKQQAPKVDFGKYSVACVFLGYDADWLYHIHIDNPAEEGNLQVLGYDMAQIILELSGPFRAAGQYRMKAFEKKKGYGAVVKKTGNDLPQLPLQGHHGHDHDPENPCRQAE